MTDVAVVSARVVLYAGDSSQIPAPPPAPSFSQKRLCGVGTSPLIIRAGWLG